MAGARKPGPQCSHSDPLDVDDGVMSRAQPHLPGPSGITSRVLGDGQRSDTNTVYSRALELAPAALYRETGCAFDSGTLQDLVPVLIQTLTTSISVGGPGATRTGKKDVLSSLGLDFLPDSADSSLGGMIRLLRMGISNMISPGQRRDACRADEIENAAEALAAAAGGYLRLILQGIVAWLLGGTSTLETVASAQGTRLPASTIVSE